MAHWCSLASKLWDAKSAVGWGKTIITGPCCPLCFHSVILLPLCSGKEEQSWVNVDSWKTGIIPVTSFYLSPGALAPITIVLYITDIWNWRSAADFSRSEWIPSSSNSHAGEQPSVLKCGSANSLTWRERKRKKWKVGKVKKTSSFLIWELIAKHISQFIWKDKAKLN